MKRRNRMFAVVNTPGGNTPVELRDVVEPEAQADEAIVEVRAFSLNWGELGLLASRPEGWRPGWDLAGVVVQAASDGSGPKEGSRVVAVLNQAGWAQRVAVPTARMAVLPESVSFAQAATLPIAGLTALRTLRMGGYPLGSRVLVTGASGAVGRFAIQLGALTGAEVTGVVSRAERAVGLRELGAASVVTSIQEAQGPYDLILESVGGSSLEQAIRLIAPNGTIVLFGNSSGEQIPFSFPALAGHAGARLIVFFSYLAGDQASFGKDLALLVSLLAANKLSPQIGSEESWRNLARVLPALRERRVNGKAIFLVD
jgi:NADPH:quinone reductase